MGISKIDIEVYNTLEDLKKMNMSHGVTIKYKDIIISHHKERNTSKNLKKCLLEFCDKL